MVNQYIDRFLKIYSQGTDFITNFYKHNNIY